MARNVLRHSERHWAQFVGTICAGDTKPDAKFRKAPTACLEVVYRDRLSVLEQVGKRIGPFVFNRIDLYAAEPDPDGESGRFPGFFVQQVATAQIDDPRSPEAVAWNARHAQTLQPAQVCDASYGDEANISGCRSRQSAGYHDGKRQFIVLPRCAARSLVNQHRDARSEGRSPARADGERCLRCHGEGGSRRSRRLFLDCAPMTSDWGRPGLAIPRGRK